MLDGTKPVRNRRFAEAFRASVSLEDFYFGRGLLQLAV